MTSPKREIKSFLNAHLVSLMETTYLVAPNLFTDYEDLPVSV